MKYKITEEIKLVANKRDLKYLILNSFRKYYQIDFISLQKLDPKTNNYLKISNIFKEDCEDSKLKECIYIPINDQIAKNDELKLIIKISGKPKYGEVMKMVSNLISGKKKTKTYLRA